MSREELQLFLADLVKSKSVTQGEADNLLALYDNGDLTSESLPSRTLPVEDDEPWEVALLVVLLLVGYGSTNRRISATVARRTRDSLRAGMLQTVTRKSTALNQGQLSIGKWHGELQENLAAYTRQMAVLGAGTLPKAGSRALVENTLEEEWPFLAKLGVFFAAAQASGRTFTDAFVTTRATQQIGAGWGAFFVGQADQHSDSYGWVERWITREDRKVCPRCAVYSRQTYLVGQGPIPGVDCYAGGYCRCLRVPEYNELAYLRLGGRA